MSPSGGPPTADDRPSVVLKRRHCEACPRRASAKQSFTFLHPRAFAVFFKISQSQIACLRLPPFDFRLSPPGV